MGQQGALPHGEIHEGGYGAPMPEDEMPDPGVPEVPAGQDAGEGPGVEPQESAPADSNRQS
jgi:hypothetical protein